MATSVLFVHGLWLHATSWQPWIDHFRASRLRSRGARLARRTRHGRGRPPGDPTRSPTTASRRSPTTTPAIIAELDAKPPIVIGHSFGGLIAQKLMARTRPPPAIAIDPAQMKGMLLLPPSSLKASFPSLKNPANKSKSVGLTAEQFRYGFGNAISEEESNALFEQWTIPSPAKPLFQAASADFKPHSEAAVDTKNSHRGPLLIIAGGQDHTVPEAVVKAEYKQYRHSTAVTELLEFPDRGHSLAIDNGWREVADKCIGG